MMQSDYQKILETLWSLSQGGLSALGLDKIAAESGVAIEEITKLFPEKHNILLCLIEDIKSKIVLPDYNEKLSARDQIFDAAMMYYDVMHPHRLAIKALYKDVLWEPLTLAPIMPALNTQMQLLIDKYVQEQGLLNFGRKFGISAAISYSFYIFLDDDTFDLSKTMAALDQALKNTDDIMDLVSSYKKPFI